MTRDQITKLAEMIVVGFDKCWTMQRVIGAAGVAVNTQEDALALHEAAPFMPDFFYAYHSKNCGAPVRAVISAEWPALYRFLDINHGKPEKLLSCVPQITRLRYTGKARHKLSAADIKDGAAIRTDAKQVATASKAVRRQQLSNQRGAWNVCKR